ncbi:MAG: pyridoxal phosphate-dependent aminotransferase [Candidatus Eisenbacteria bacterium]|nr:pyridoxal phosphate-dependent aminotransferase [Candidatus Eisenbacteria bacterium]
MKLPIIEYLRWARETKDVPFDLSRSGMEEIPLERLGVPPEKLLVPESSEWGSPTLRSAIAASYGLPEKNVLPANGTTFALFLVYAALLDSGSRVLVEEPAYEPIRRIPALLGARIDRLPRPFEKGFRFDRERLLDALAPDVRLVALTDPHNPSGVRLTREERDWLAAVAEDRGVDILVDEVYADFARPDGSAESPEYANAFRHGTRMISVGSLTKVYGLGRLRVGWILAREEVIRRAAPFYDYTIGDLSGPSVALGVAALAKREELRRPAEERAARCLAIVSSWIKERPDLEWVRPDTGITAFPRLRERRDLPALLERARREQGVLAVPGSYFEDARGFRLGFGLPPALLSVALERLGMALSDGP